MEIILNLLPYDKFELVVTLPRSEVCKRISDNTSEESFFWFASDKTLFKGKVEDDNFKIHKRIIYRNSFLPILHGEIDPVPGGTRIAIKMKLHKFTQAFLLFWSLMAAFSQSSGRNYEFALTMILIAVLMTYLGFWFEVPRSRRALVEIFEPEIITTGGIQNEKYLKRKWSIIGIICGICAIALIIALQSRLSSSFKNQIERRVEESVVVKSSLVKIIKNGQFKGQISCCNIHKDQITPDEYEEFARQINALTPTKDIGQRGPWENLAWINFDTAGDVQYQVILSTRPSLQGKARATVQIKGKTDYVTHYDADEMWKWLVDRDTKFILGK